MTSRRDRSDATARAATEPSDRLIAGRYRLGAVVGRGGMATIYRAEDTRLGRTVALKLLRPEITADPDLADRFRREALATTVLRHRNIVGCIDTGSDPSGPFMIMELVDGEDLAARLRRDGSLPPDDAARIGLDIARGLGAAHLRGIVHRDVKPSNILLARDGRAMITDFGIARLAADAEAAMPGTTLGSVQYFSPEQARGATTTPASDVYGLGLVLYEALTGQRPWHGDTSADLALARVGAASPSPRDVQPDVPLALDAVVTTALAAEPEGRYPSGNAMALALEPLASASASAPTPAPGPRRSRPPTPKGLAPARARRRAGRLRSVAVVAVAALVIGGFGMVVLGADRGGSGDAASEAPERTASSTDRPTSDPAAATDETGPVVPAADVCQPLQDVPCSLEAARYAPAGFFPPLEFDVGTGWSTAKADPDLLILARDEGLLTFASGVAPVTGSAEQFGSGSAKAVVAAFAKTAGLKASKPAAVTIDGHKGRSVDVKPTDSKRKAMFKTNGETFHVEAGRTTRLVALDTDQGTVVLVIEPSSGHTLRQVLKTADVVASTVTFH